MATSDHNTSKPGIPGRIFKLLRRILLGLFVALLLFIGAIHLPPVQRWITGEVSSTLSEKTQGTVTIDMIKFSLLGDFEILDLEIADPGGENFFFSKKIAVTIDPGDLILGKLNFNSIEMDGVNFNLIQDKDNELNIQFIIDAFHSSEQTQTIEDKNNENFSIKFGMVSIRDIKFRFSSTHEPLDLFTEVGSLKLDSSELGLDPNKIVSRKVYLDSSIVKLIMADDQTAVDSTIARSVSNLPLLDFGSGFDFDIQKLELFNDSFSFHINQVEEPLRFDPNHLNIGNINLKLADLVIRKDTLGVNLEEASLEMPEYKLDNLKADVNVTLQQLLTNLELHAAGLNIDLQFGASYDSLPVILDNLDQSRFQLTVSGSGDRSAVSYFLRDSIASSFDGWQEIDLELDVAQNGRKGQVNKLKLKSGNSILEGSGTIIDVFGSQKVSWSEIVINTTVGSAFRNSISGYLTGIVIPQKFTLVASSSGNQQHFKLDGNIETSLGNLDAAGSAGIMNDEIDMDLSVNGERIEVGKLMDLNWMGPVTVATRLTGHTGQDLELDLEGTIKEMLLLDEMIRDIDFNGLLHKNQLTSSITIHDPDFTSQLDTDIEFSDSMKIQSVLQLNKVGIGRLILSDTSFQVSGTLNSKIELSPDKLDAVLLGKGLDLTTSSLKYHMDSLDLKFSDSTSGSFLKFTGENLYGVYSANFAIQQLSDVLKSTSEKYTSASGTGQFSGLDREFQLELDFDNPIPFQLIGINIDDFSQLKVKGTFLESQDLLDLQTNVSNFRGFDVSFDSLYLDTDLFKDSLGTQLIVTDLFYDSLWLGNSDSHLSGTYDSLSLTTRLRRDSSNFFGIGSTLRLNPDGIYIEPDTMTVLDKNYLVKNNNPVIINKDNIYFNQFSITRDNTIIEIDGTPQEVSVNIENGSLDYLNYLFLDSTLIHQGKLNGSLFYSQPRKQLDLKVDIDSLVINEYPPIKITGLASTEGTNVPFRFDLASATNNIDLSGNYSFKDSGINADLNLNLNDLLMFEILTSEYVDEISGGISGQTEISGTLFQPEFEGNFRFQNVKLVNSSPSITINIHDETIDFDNSGITLEKFTVYDQNQNPLVINGFIRSKDFQQLDYDVSITTDNYLLINNPDSDNGQLQGYMVIGSDLNISGNEKDAKVRADILVKDSTDLTYKVPAENIELITSEGIVEFVDPYASEDSASALINRSYYDSLLATLPGFELTSNITLEENAVLRILIDPRSGDYIESSGEADLQIDMNRKGNLRLSGVYTIKDGSYQLSFYDIVKRKFLITPGSSITWNGDPNSGNLDITALHTIKTSSTGLIGHEVGENEKAIYRRTLPYEVGIIISGFVESPEISFSLDLPQEEKINYPALASKLNRLKQPEFQSELNKQVFGLLVLGGFIPESSGSELDQSLVATTAISNSVNSILASQLNRFASQYIKGLDIDVGLQSYMDYTGRGGQTKTAMDFRVTKRMMDDRLSFEIGGNMDISTDQSGPNTGSDNFRGDIAIIYDLTESGNKQLKAFNNETYDIIYHQVRNTGVSLIFIREFDGQKGKEEK